MRSNYRKLGEYIREVNIRNKDLQVSLLLGVSISKEFIPSIANTVGTDFSNYKIVEKGQFAYGPVTSRNGDKISIALLKEDKCIISSSYMVFEIIDKSVLLPEYLMMWFRRPEFDRYARFKSEGSVREIFSWNEMCNIELPVPDIDKQRKIVEQYNQINKAIQIKEAINNNLEQQAQAIFKSWFVDFEPFEGRQPYNWEYSEIGDIGLDISDGNYSAKYPKSTEFVDSGIPFIRGTNFKGHFISLQGLYFITPEKHSELLKGHTKKGDILITTRGEIGKIAFVPDNLIDVNINSQLVRINGNGILPRSFLACSLLSDRMTNEFKMLVSGSALQQLPVNKFKQMKLLMPDSETLNKFDSICSKIYDKIFINVAEINNLLLFLNTILPKLMLENSDSSTAKLSFI